MLRSEEELPHLKEKESFLSSFSRFSFKQQQFVLIFLPLSQMWISLQKDFRVQELPLARIKKIMKLDEDVKVPSWLLSEVFMTLLVDAVAVIPRNSLLVIVVVYHYF